MAQNRLDKYLQLQTMLLTWEKTEANLQVIKQEYEPLLEGIGAHFGLTKEKDCSHLSDDQIIGSVIKACVYLDRLDAAKDDQERAFCFEGLRQIQVLF